MSKSNLPNDETWRIEHNEIGDTEKNRESKNDPIEIRKPTEDDSKFHTKEKQTRKKDEGK